jgi:peptidoglycan hydrolase-like protein with peptidoglycan-binding domain
MLKKIAFAGSTLLLFAPLFAFGASACVTISGPLSLGSTGSQVQALQFYFTQVYTEFTRDHVTGTFDAFTESALQQWQREHGIVSSGTPESTGWGVVGPRTRNALSCSSQSASPSSDSASSSGTVATSAPAPVSNPGSTLSIGSTGPAVLEVQQVLIAQGLLSPDSATGYFGPLTQAAVRVFQAANDIVASGTPSSTGYGAVGPRTIAAIRAAHGSDGQANGENRNTFQGSNQVIAPVVAPVATDLPCSFAGVQMQSGSSRVFYSQFSLSTGGDCSQFSQVRQCVNGTLTGGSQYQYTSCAALQNAQQCNVNGTLIQNGASVTLYSQPSVGYGASCSNVSQLRTCINGAMTGSYQYTYPSCVVSSPSACSTGAATIASGNSATFYSQQTVPFGSTCASVAQSRTCNNGSLNGSSNYPYTSCAAAASPNCTLDGVTVANGAKQTFYSASTAAYGTTCASVSKQRTCTNGSLGADTSYSHASCTVAGPASCTLDGITVASGASHSFYTASTVPFGSKCPAAVSRTCNNGTLSSSGTSAGALYASCTVGSAAACILDGTTVPSGSSRTFYYAQNIPAGESCSSYGISRTCNNGTLSGTDAYKYASCAPSAAGSCTLDSAVVQSGQSRDFFSLATAPAGQLCSTYKLSRSCNSGTLSGNNSFNRASCSDSASCTVDGTTVPSGSSALFYSAASVPFGNSCTAVSQSRTCTNGSLSGSASYKYAACAPIGAASCTLSGLTVAHGTSQSFYSVASVPFGSTCSSVEQSRTCQNGTLDGTNTYKYSSCTVTPPSSDPACTLDSVAVQSGSSRTFYSVSAAPVGKLCSAYDQVRSCSKGNLGGTAAYKYASCTDSASCTLAGVTVQDGGSAPFYAADISKNCTSIVRTCTNGSLSGSASYKYAACRAPQITVTSPAAGSIYNAATPVPVAWTAETGITNVAVSLYKGGVLQNTSPAITAQSSTGGGTASFSIAPAQTLGTDYTIRVKDSAANGASQGESPVFTVGYATNPVTVTIRKTAFEQGEAISYTVTNNSGITTGFHSSIINTDTQTSVKTSLTGFQTGSWGTSAILAEPPSGHYIVKIYTDVNPSVSGVSAPFTIGTVTSSNADKFSQIANTLTALDSALQSLMGLLGSH